jgi:hypothetical protein
MTFNIEKTLSVTYKGNPIEYLNEMEYVDGKIYTNIYGVGKIIVINADNGIVESEIDCSAIDCAQIEANDKEAVLAHTTDTRANKAREMGAKVDIEWNQALGIPTFWSVVKGAPNKEAAMRALRKVLPKIDLESEEDDEQNSDDNKSNGSEAEEDNEQKSDKNQKELVLELLQMIMKLLKYIIV